MVLGLASLPQNAVEQHRGGVNTSVRRTVGCEMEITGRQDGGIQRSVICLPFLERFFPCAKRENLQLPHHMINPLGKASKNGVQLSN
jgi:hypothetical protein